MENERARFVLEAEASELSHSELCRRHNISRPTGHKWIRRFQAEKLEGLADRSHRPHSRPHATSSAVVKRVLEIRERYEWGARKIRRKAEKDPSVPAVPRLDTIRGSSPARVHSPPHKPLRRRTHTGPPLPVPPQANATWTADFKSEFRTRDGKLCFPLTIQDGYSRYLLACQGMLRLDLDATLQRFHILFREFGLPQRSRTDNGHPFASTAIAGLSQLSVWWISLGILPELVEPGTPHQNGRHERMHRTLKERTASPPASNLRAQQRAFNRFRRTHNNERPHEALENADRSSSALS